MSAAELLSRFSVLSDDICWSKPFAKASFESFELSKSNVYAHLIECEERAPTERRIAETEDCSYVSIAS